MKLCLLIQFLLVSAVLPGCQITTPLSPDHSSEEAGQVRITKRGEVTMASDGTLIFEYDPSPGLPNGRTMTLKPDNPNYNRVLRNLGGMSAGERRAFSSVFDPAATVKSGSVKMLLDQRLFVELRLSNNGIVGDSAYYISRDEPGYDEMLERVGGLYPGEEKSILPYR